MVEDVVELRAEFYMFTFRDCYPFQDVHVPVVRAWCAQRIPTQIAETGSRE